MPKPPALRLISLVLLLTVLGLVPLSAACGDDGTVDVASADVERESPSVPAEDLTELGSGNAAFAFDLNQLLAADTENLIFSPYSISIALAMTYSGARGATEQEMADALHFTLPQDRLHAAFNALDRELAERGQVDLDDEDATPPELRTANATWADSDYDFLDSYLETLGRNYGAGVRLLDFRADPEGARDEINGWVEEQTEDRIKDLIPEGSIDALTRLVLTNAIYFKGSWVTPFDADLTAPGEFQLLDGGTSEATFMHVRGARARYADLDTLQAVELPYVGGQISMLLLVPGEGEFDQVQQSLDEDVLENAISALAPASVTLALPKFEFEWEQSLVDPLMELGMVSAFENADFSGMDGTRNLVITDVIHKAFISVNEEGTEAAAATAVIVGETSSPEIVEVEVDRPFIFLIRDNETGTILFFGRVLRP